MLLPNLRDRFSGSRRGRVRALASLPLLEFLPDDGFELLFYQRLWKVKMMGVG